MDGTKFDHPIHIIGVGATGSYIALLTAKTTGSSKITIWDFDKVEGHNLPNQLYGPEHIGMEKTEACFSVIKEQTGVEVEMEGKCTPDAVNQLNGVVFLAVDSMETRKEIWDNCIKLNPLVVRMIEMRLGIEMGVVHIVDPNSVEDVKGWEKEWYPDSEAEQSPCTNRMISTTVATMAGLSVHHLINIYKDREIPPRLLVDMSSFSFEAFEWAKEEALASASV